MSSAQDQTAGYGTGRPDTAEASQQERAAARDPQAQYGTGQPASRYDDGGMSGTQSGFTVLAATLMILSGLWGFFEGLLAIMHQSFFVTTGSNYTYTWNLNSWGWLHLALGIVIFAAGVCVLLGQTWAKALGIMLAVFSGIANFLFLPHYPIWSIIVIALDVFIIWALASGIGRRAAV